MAFAQLVQAAPIYRDLTLEEIGGRGVRWQEREAASAFPASDSTIPATSESSPGGLAGSDRRAAADSPATNGALRLGRYRPIWAAPEVEISPALKFTVARQQVELSPEDAQRLGVTTGDAVDVAQNGTRLKAVAHVRTGVPSGTAFLAEGIAIGSANVFTEPAVEVEKR
jgi:NADH-quinone oxidoreductase subunit G